MKQILDGRYRIIREIGRGGNGCVYLAESLHIPKYWAIKEIYKKGPHMAGVLLAESNILTKLSHPGLPMIFDVFQTYDAYYIVMEYIEGVSLNKVLERSGAQPEQTVVSWGIALCQTLQYLHSQKQPIIYRDMKPANIMLKPNGKITLIDFGAAREYKSASRGDTVAMGTYGYAAPEQCIPGTQSDARTDIYGLGVTLYQLLTNRNPCQETRLPPVRQINPGISEQLEKILIRCMQFDPEKRYGSAAELEEALRGLTEEKPRPLWQIFLPVGAAVMALLMVIGIAFAAVHTQEKPENPVDSIVHDRAVIQGEITEEGKHLRFRLHPEDSGLYRFTSSGTEAIPAAWLSDNNNVTLCESNTYATENEFDFAYRLIAGETYWLEITLCYADQTEATGKITVYIDYEGE